MPDLTIRRATLQDMDDVARLCWAYRDVLVARSTDLPAHMIDTYYAREDYGRLLSDLPRIHARPKGDIIVAETGGQTVGCAMYYPINATTTEIKRVFVDAAARGLGAGRALMRDGMARARADGYSRMVLDTMVNLTEAIALYEALGFAPCAPYYQADPELLPYLRFYDIPL
ncbi:MAG: GNAT family N-acetyltransferase [Pseudomonadota bacterium]